MSVLCGEGRLFNFHSALSVHSIALASHYTEQIGDVDIVADAKNIKKLLMTPYRCWFVLAVVFPMLIILIFMFLVNGHRQNSVFSLHPLLLPLSYLCV